MRDKDWLQWVAVGLALVACATAVVLLAPSTQAALILDPAGPLVQIHVSRNYALDCQVMYQGQTYVFAGSESDGEFWGPGSCGTFLRAGSVTYGPPVAGFGGPLNPGNPLPTPFTPVSQSLVTGTGTAGDPWTVVTVVSAGPTLLVNQTDQYYTGDGFYTTSVTVTNTGPPSTFILYRAGDCVLGATDEGYGWRDATTHAVACTEVAGGGSGRVIGWIPGNSTMGTATGQEDTWDTIWDRPGVGAAYTNGCLCGTFLDNGGGLSWTFHLDQGQNATMSHRNLFSPNGIPPMPPPPPPGPPPPPQPDFSAMVVAITCSNATWHFAQTGTTGPPNGYTSWAWDFGDGQTGTGPSVDHTYGRPRSYLVTHTATGPTGSDAINHTIAVGFRPPCPPTLDPLPRQVVHVGETVTVCAVGHGGMGGDLSYSAEGLPTNATFDPYGPCLTWLTTKSDVGSLACIQFTVTETLPPDPIRPDLPPMTASRCLAVRVLAEGVPIPDDDRDGVADDSDNCPHVANRDQSDADGDGQGDACQETLSEAGPNAAGRGRKALGLQDSDQDGVFDAVDLCPAVPDHSQADLDGDGYGDACDLDVDGDGIEDGHDDCPYTTDPSQDDPCANAKAAPAHPDRVLGKSYAPDAMSLQALAAGATVFVAAAVLLLAVAVRRHRPRRRTR